MGTYIIPRNVKGEGRILLFFSPKSFLFMIAGIIIGTIIYSLLKMIGANTVGLALLIIISIISLGIGTLRIPNSRMFDFTKKTGGESLDDIITRYILFRKKRCIYVYTDKDISLGNTKE